MIDEKKIEKAASTFANENYATNDACERAVKNFKAGAEWAQQEFVKSLWHDASEERPKENIPVVIFYERGDYAMANCPLAEWAEKEYGWKFAKKWLYVRDLLPEEKGGEL